MFAKAFTARIPEDTFTKLYELQAARSEREKHRIPIYCLITEALERYLAKELPRFVPAPGRTTEGR
jgi:hypothetical protein